MCDRKRVHMTEEDAIREAKRLEGVEGDRFRHYECPFCHFWHVSHTHKYDPSVGQQ